jgi:lipid II:glycine glycyltransferase (peptidoglycan interpeptide bridge formation enzyme)
MVKGHAYEFRRSESAGDAEWDAFLAGVEGGHHVQTTLWARVKAVIGWDALRVIVVADGRIVGGGQLFLRTVPLIGAVGYVPKGPVVSVDDPALRSQLIDSLMEEARLRRVRHLTIQPANNGHAFTQNLADRGFRPSAVPVAPQTSLVIDLGADIATIFAQLSSKTRYNVRLGERSGIKIREGGEADLSTYYRMLVTTGDRQGFTVYPEEYFTEMWQWLRPHGYVRLFLAEYEGDVMSGQLVVPFGDTVINKLSVWSGRHGSKRPNHTLQWHAIEWSKANGYRYYDFEGIDRRAVESARENEPLPQSLKQTVTSFKLGFGGEPVLFPSAQYHVGNALVRWGYESVFRRVSDWPLVKKAVGRFRSGRRRINRDRHP